ncbi:hypothetical protein [Deinococcus malanensis]|nr:hypothetical protein [Deinococcus malanensis]
MQDNHVPAALSACGSPPTFRETLATLIHSGLPVPVDGRTFAQRYASHGATLLHTLIHP